jgi:hypothetical protein
VLPFEPVGAQRRAVENRVGAGHQTQTGDHGSPARLDLSNMAPGTAASADAARMPTLAGLSSGPPPPKRLHGMAAGPEIRRRSLAKTSPRTALDARARALGLRELLVPGLECSGECLRSLHLSPGAFTKRATTYGHGVTTRSSTKPPNMATKRSRPSMIISFAGSQTARSHTALAPCSHCARQRPREEEYERAIRDEPHPSDTGYPLTSRQRLLGEDYGPDGSHHSEVHDP